MFNYSFLLNLSLNLIFWSAVTSLRIHKMSSDSSPANMSPSSSSSYPLSSSSSSEQLSTEVNRPQTQQAPIVDRSKCPLCDKTFSRSTGVNRHIKDKHPESIDTVDKSTIKSVRHPCQYCGNMYSNLSKHYKHCKSKKTSKPVASKRTSSAASEGLSIVSAYEEYLQKQKLSPKYLRKLVAKLRRIITCWEENIDNFIGDNLLDPFKTKTILPSLAVYLDGATTLGDKKQAINAYVNLCDFLIYHLDIKYAANKKIKVHYRTAYTNNILTLRQYESKKIKKVDKKQRGQTRLAAAKKARNPEELNYNSKRLKVVVTSILQDEKMVSMRKTLTERSLSWIKSNLKEIEVRHFLMSQLWVTGAGHRPSAITNMTVKELREATSTTDTDVKLVMVEYHKTKEAHGPAKIPFVLPLLYEACTAYMKVWRNTPNPNARVFATSGKNNQPADFKYCIKWLIRTLDVLKASFTLKELDSLSGGTMRKGWTNWAKKSPNKFIKEIADRVMCHSEWVSNTSYLEPTGNEVGIFAGNVVGSMDPARDIDNDARNSSDSAEEGEVDNDTSNSSDSVKQDEIGIPSRPTLPSSLSPPPPLSPTQPTTQNQGGEPSQVRYIPGIRFSDSERELICFALSNEDGQLPKNVTNFEANRAIEKSPEFQNLYENLVRDRGSKGQANKTLTSSIKYKYLRAQK